MSRASHASRGGAALAFAAMIISTPLAAQEALTFDAAVQRALAKNFTIQVESYLVPIAETAIAEARGRFDPRLTFSYQDGTDEQPDRSQNETPLPATSYKFQRHQLGVTGELPLGLTYEIGARNSNDRFSASATPFSDVFSDTAGVSARLPLLRGFGPAATLTSVRIARTNRAISEWDFHAAVINTVTEVTYACNDLLFAAANLRSARRSRELAAQLFEENQRRNAVGSMSDYEVLSARARVATREEGILVAQRFVRETENRLKQLISDDSSPALLTQALELVPPPAPLPVTVNPAADVAAALAHRPDYQQARLALDRNDLSLRFQRNQLLPAVDLVGGYGYNGTGADFDSSRRQISNRDNLSYHGGVTLSIPLTSTSERARYRNARLQRERAELSLRQLEQDIVVRVGNAAGQIDTAWQRVQASRASRELSQQALDAEVKRLRAGPGRTFDVLQLQEILSNDEVREARAISDYRKALAEYDRQLGRTLEAHHIDLAHTGDATRLP